jgi:chorismate mutase
MDIESLRQEIDKLDAELVRLLNHRARLVVEIGQLKRSSNMPVVELKREHVIYENAAANNEGPLASQDLHRIFERIIDIMRNIQRAEIVAGKPHVPAVEPPPEDVLD